MSWKIPKRLPWKGTLKLQAAGYLLCGTALTLVCAMLLAYLSQRHFLLSTARRKLQIFSTEFVFEYVCQREEPPGGTICPLPELPLACRQAMQRQEPPLTPLAAYHVEETGEIYLATLSQGMPALALYDSLSRQIVSVLPSDPDIALNYLDQEFNEESYGQGIDKLFFLLTDSQGDAGARSAFRPQYLPLFTRLFREAPPREGFHTLNDKELTVLLHVKRLFDGNYLLIGENIHDSLENLHHLLLFFVLLFLASLPMEAILATLFAKRISSGLERLGNAADAIAKGNFTLRLATNGESRELTSLMEAFNHMTDNTQKLLEELQNVTDDIAHDLRTPLTRMRTRAELELLHRRDQDFPALVAEECDDLIATMQTMLDITRLEKRLDRAPTQPTNLNLLLQRLQEAFSTLAEDRKILLQLELPTHPVIYPCNPRQWERMAANLLDNALKYTPAMGTVTLRLETFPQAILLSVQDSGPGIPQEEQTKVFQRFYRSDASRSRPGNGLGLSLVKAVAESLGGTVRVVSAPGRGSLFQVTLPRERRDKV